MRYSDRAMLGLGHNLSVATLTNLFLTLAELLLLLRVILKFFFTSAGGGFVHWAYSTTNVLLEPFRGLFTNVTSTPTNWHVDWVALLAMAVYAAGGASLIGLARWAAGWNAVTRR
jgi:hypothetical protein